MLLKSFSFYGLSRILVVGGQFLFVPIAVGQLGAAGYGLYSLILQGALLVRLVTLQGVAQVLARDYQGFVAKYGENRVYWAALMYVMMSLVLLLVIVVPFSAQFGALYHLPSGHVWLAIAMGAALAWFGIKHVMVYCQGLRAYTIWDTSMALGVLLVPVIFGSVFPAVEAYAAAYIFVTLSLTILMLRYQPASMPMMTTVKQIGSSIQEYGFLLMLGEALSWIVAVADRFQIAALIGTEQTGIYTAAYQLFVAPMNVLGFAVAVVIQPAAFASDLKIFRVHMEQAAALLTVLSISCVALAVIFGREAFAIFFRHQAEIDPALILLLTLTGVANSFFQLELIAGKYRRNGKVILGIQAGAAILLLVGNWLLLPLVGILGAATTSLCAYLFMIALLRHSTEKQMHFSYCNLVAVRAAFSKLLSKRKNYGL